MPKLKLGTILDDRPVKLTIELPAQLNRDLIAYADVLGRETGQTVEPAKLIAPMLTPSRAEPRMPRSSRIPRSPTSAFGSKPVVVARSTCASTRARRPSATTSS